METIVYIVVKSGAGGDDYNIAAYTDLGKALDRCKKEENDPDNKPYTYWVDSIDLN